MNEVSRLEVEILRHKTLYYKGSPEISNSEYDQLENKLRKLDPQNPLLGRVGAAELSSRKIRHNSKMLSLDKTYKQDDLYKWIGGEKVVSMYKVDGSSCSLVYEEGKLYQGKTRGDGQFGEDVLDKVAWIQGIPMKIKKTIGLSQYEVRGEVYCNDPDFHRLSKEMESLGLEKPSSKRNIVAGLLGRKENVQLCRFLSFFAFDLMTDETTFDHEWQKIERLSGMGFQVPKPIYHENTEKIEDTIREVESFMMEGEYLVDGIVFTYDSLALHEELGSTSHHPRYRLAFKFQGERARTEVISITWSVSRNGHLIPVGHVTPVALSGAKISRVTLHNYSQVKENGIKEGDEIEIVRSGEVIPKFLSVTKSKQGKTAFPHICPVCKTELQVLGVHLNCPNQKCSERVKEGILHFIQKIGVENLSFKRLDAMWRQRLVLNIADLYSLNEEKLLTLEKTKQKLAQKILVEVEKSKDVSLVTFLAALGISGGAYSKCEKVVEAGFNTLDKLKKVTEEDICQVESFAEKSSKEFVSSLSSKWSLVDELVVLGVKPRSPESKGSRLLGKKLVITGALLKKRSEVEKEIKLQGGVVSSGVSKATDYVVTNDANSGSAKIKKAEELKIAILSEQELFGMINE